MVPQDGRSALSTSARAASSPSRTERATPCPEWSTRVAIPTRSTSAEHTVSWRRVLRYEASHIDPMRHTIVLLAILAAVAPATAGVTLVMEESGKPPSTLSFEGNKLRIEDEAQVVIFDGDAKSLVSLDPAGKSYGMVTEAEARELGAQERERQEQRRAQMESALAALPPERQQELRAMMKRGEGKLRIVPLGKKNTAIGLRCDEYRIYVDDEPDEEGCFIPWSAETIRREELEVFERFGDFMRLMTGLEIGSAGRMSRYPGLPAVNRDLTVEDGTTERLKSLTRGTIPPEKFTVPADYRRVGP